MKHIGSKDKRDRVSGTCETGLSRLNICNWNPRRERNILRIMAPNFPILIKDFQATDPRRSMNVKQHKYKSHISIS